MHVVSDEERREVARRLRDKKAECEERGYPWMCDDLILALGYDHDYEAGDEIFDRLADLIEPALERTCRVESSHEVEGDGCYSYFEYELTCGHEIAWGDQLPPRYCPECGRRVLYDSDDYI